MDGAKIQNVLMNTKIKKVSIRDFTKKPTEYLNELPIMLTRYNIDIALVIDKRDVAQKTSYSPDNYEKTN